MRHLGALDPAFLYGLLAGKDRMPESLAAVRSFADSALPFKRLRYRHGVIPAETRITKIGMRRMNGAV